MKRRVHAREQIDGVGDSAVAHNQPGALLHRLLAKVEHAAVAADQHGIVAEAKQRLGQILAGADQNLAQAEVVGEKRINAARKRQPIGRRDRRLGRGRQIPALFQDSRRCVRPHDPDRQRRGQKQQCQNGEIPAPAQEHVRSGPVCVVAPGAHRRSVSKPSGRRRDRRAENVRSGPHRHSRDGICRSASPRSRGVIVPSWRRFIPQRAKPASMRRPCGYCPC